MPREEIVTKRYYRGYEVPAKHVRNRHAAAFAEGVDAVLDDNADYTPAVQRSFETAADDFAARWITLLEPPQTVNYGDPEPDRAKTFRAACTNAVGKCIDYTYRETTSWGVSGWCWCENENCSAVFPWDEFPKYCFPLTEVK